MTTQSSGSKQDNKRRDTKTTKGNQTRNFLFKNHPIKVAVMIDGGFFIKRYNYN